MQGASVDIGIALAGGSTPGGDDDGASLGSVFSIIFFMGVFVTIIFSIISSIGYATLSFYLDLAAPAQHLAKQGACGSASQCHTDA